MQKLWLVLTLALALSGFAAGCGDDADGDGTGGTGGGTPEPASGMIDAAEGGEVETSGAAVEIPAGALDEDTEITIEPVADVENLPDADSIASDVFDFGPDGTTFAEPVTLTLELTASAPEGMEPKMAWLDEETDSWVTLADSSVEGDTVVASTDHFTYFAIIWTATGQVGGACDDTDFEACGGDIEGTWEFTLGCLTIPPSQSPAADLFEDCASATVAAGIDLTGTATFGADGSFDVEQNFTQSLTVTAPYSCLPDGVACEDLVPQDDTEESPFVITDTGTACELATPEQMAQIVVTGTYELEGDTFITTEEGETDPGEPLEYCVEGDVLTVRSVEVDETTGEEQTFLYRAERQ